MIKRLQWPVRLNAAGTGFRTVEQGSTAEILQCAENAIKTIRGSRVTSPDYGVDEQLFELGGYNPVALVDAIKYSEPRASASVDVSDLTEMVNRVIVKVSA